MGLKNARAPQNQFLEEEVNLPIDKEAMGVYNQIKKINKS